MTAAVRVSLALATGLCVAWALVSLWYPFGWDHGILAMVGDTVVRGGMPYRDGFETKGPLSFLFFSAAQLVFGRTQFGIRVVDLILLTAAATVLSGAGARLVRRSAGPWIAVAFVLAYASQTFFHTAQADGVVAFFLTLALAPLLSGVRSARHEVIAGFLVGCCALIKPFYAAYLAVPVLAILFMDDRGLRARIIAATRACLAAAAPVAGMMLWFWQRDALDELIAVHLRYSADSYSGVLNLSLRNRLRGLVEYVSTVPVSIAVPFLVFGAWTLWREKRREAVLLLAWLGLGVALVILQDKFFPYHWTIVIPPALLLVSAGIPQLRVLGWTAVAALLIPLTVQPARDISNWLRYVTGRETRAVYYGRFGNPKGGLFSAGDDMAAADFLQQQSAPGDALVNFGYNAPAAYLSGLAIVSRFGYNAPVVSPLTKQSVQEALRQEFMAEVDRARPRFVMVGFQATRKAHALASFPAFVDYVGRNYRLERSFGEIDIYQRLDPMK